MAPSPIHFPPEMSSMSGEDGFSKNVADKSNAGTPPGVVSTFASSSEVGTPIFPNLFEDFELDALKWDADNEYYNAQPSYSPPKFEEKSALPPSKLSESHDATSTTTYLDTGRGTSQGEDQGLETAKLTVDLIAKSTNGKDTSGSSALLDNNTTKNASNPTFSVPGVGVPLHAPSFARLESRFLADHPSNLENERSLTPGINIISPEVNFGSSPQESVFFPNEFVSDFQSPGDFNPGTSSTLSLVSCSNERAGLNQQFGQNSLQQLQHNHHSPGFFNPQQLQSPNSAYSSYANFQFQVNNLPDQRCSQTGTQSHSAPPARPLANTLINTPSRFRHQSVARLNSQAFTKMKREPSSPSSHTPRMKREINNASQSSSASLSMLTINRQTQLDARCIRLLMSSMCDMSATEDNRGMLMTWDKTMTMKPEKVQRACEEILNKMKESHRLNGCLGEKKSTNSYATFEDRFNATMDALRSQKTMCKHLLEEPYLFQVVDDPISAVKRVQNNRRVNNQKKGIIEEGKEIYRQKGLISCRNVNSVEAESVDNENSADEPLSDDDAEAPATTPKPELPSKKKTKRIRRTSKIDREYTASPGPKKVKRESRSIYQTRGGIMVDTSENSQYEQGNSQERRIGNSFAQDTGQISNGNLAEYCHELRDNSQCVDSPYCESHSVPVHNNLFAPQQHQQLDYQGAPYPSFSTIGTNPNTYSGNFGINEYANAGFEREQNSPYHPLGLGLGPTV